MRWPALPIAIVLAACGGAEVPLPADTGWGQVPPPIRGITDATPAVIRHPVEPTVPGRARWVQVSGHDEAIVCEQPKLRLDQRWDDWEVPVLDIPEEHPYRLVGGALAIEDFTGNGHLDIIVAGHDQIMLLEGDGTGLIRREDALFPEQSLVSGIASLTAFDADGDGSLDLLVSVWGEGPQLWRNDGAGRFTDDSEAFGMPTEGTRYLQAGAGDPDADGDLDVFVSGYGITPYENDNDFVGDDHLLLRNDGGTFTDVSDLIPDTVHDGYGFTGVFQDANDDGLQDLLIMHDFGQHVPSKTLWSTGDAFEVDDGEAGLDYVHSSMGVAVADMNFDGLPDFVQTSASAHPLYLSLDGVWMDHDELAGFVPDASWPSNQKFGWGLAVTDLDNDRLHDVVIGFGHWDEYGGPRTAIDAMWRQTELETFDNVSAEWQLDQDGITRAVLAADLNEDGWPDVIKRYLDGSTSVQVSRCGSNHWLDIRLRDDAINSHAVGARIELDVGDTIYTDWVRAGGTSLFASAPYELHFGLGPITAIDELRITWPDGELTTLHDIPANRRLHVHRRIGERADLASLHNTHARSADDEQPSDVP